MTRDPDFKRRAGLSAIAGLSLFGRLQYNISAFRGCFSLKFLNALEIAQGVLAHTPTETPPQKKTIIVNIYNWLKIQRV